MEELMNNLLEPQGLEFGCNPTKETRGPIAKLQEKIPANILGHYCTGCHMRVPLATVMNLGHAEHIRLCDNCGRYLYLPEDEAAPAQPQPPRPKRPTAGRKSSSATVEHRRD